MLHELRKMRERVETAGQRPTGLHPVVQLSTQEHTGPLSSTLSISKGLEILTKQAFRFSDLDFFRLFAIIWAESKSLHNQLISVFFGCVHFATQRPGVESV